MNTYHVAKFNSKEERLEHLQKVYQRRHDVAVFECTIFVVDDELDSPHPFSSYMGHDYAETCIGITHVEDAIKRARAYSPECRVHVLMCLNEQPLFTSSYYTPVDYVSDRLALINTMVDVLTLTELK